MYFCIRDDDTSFFTKPEELESAYGEIAKWGPVSLAVVPFHKAGTSKAVPEAMRGRWTVHPLHENRELVDYLRTAVKDGKFEIMLHGYHHDEIGGEFEFAQPVQPSEKIGKGRAYLENLLETRIRVFVPPHNAIGRSGMSAIAAHNLGLGGIGGLKVGWSLGSFRSWALWTRLRIRKLKGNTNVPWVLDLGDHREIPGVALTPAASFHESNRCFDSALKVGGVFCIATHYWELKANSRFLGEPNVGEQLLHFVSRARDDRRVVWRSVGDVVASCSSLVG